MNEDNTVKYPHILQQTIDQNNILECLLKIESLIDLLMTQNLNDYTKIKIYNCL